MATKGKVKPKCCVCGCEIEGEAGYTYEMFKYRGGVTKYYCYDCIDRLSDEALAQEKKNHD